MVNQLLFFVSIFIFQEVTRALPRSYYIKDGIGSSYMYRRFSYVREEIFPIDIRIQLSISRVAGTLMYSIDRHMNQLILSLNNVISPVLVIEFRKHTFYEPLNTFCNCTRCRYEILDIRVQMRSRIHLQCNMLTIKTIPYDEAILVNKDYPIPYTTDVDSVKRSNDAHLWLINTPQYGSVYPNNKQLTGCIFKVTYNDEPLVFTNLTTDIGSECTRTCTDNICNGGTCYETYKKYPRCNCTMTFRNGRFCNEAKKQLNFQSESINLIFDKFKVSWNSSINSLMVINNSNVQLRLYYEKSTMIFAYSISDRRSIYVEGILSDNYDPNYESILIGSFTDTSIVTQFYNNGSWYHTNIPTNRDLRREIFTSITLTSGDNGIIDFIYKTSSYNYVWIGLSLARFKNVKHNKIKANNLNSNHEAMFIPHKKNETAILTVVEHKSKDNICQRLIVAGITLVVTLLFIFVIMEGSAIVCTFRKPFYWYIISKNRQRYLKMKTEHIPESIQLTIDSNKLQEITEHKYYSSLDNVKYDQYIEIINTTKPVTIPNPWIEQNLSECLILK